LALVISARSAADLRQRSRLRPESLPALRSPGSCRGFAAARFGAWPSPSGPQGRQRLRPRRLAGEQPVRTTLWPAIPQVGAGWLSRRLTVRRRWKLPDRARDGHD